ncbi:floral homeotic protein HUA1 [Prunus dulcis]|uniref:Floral homeotic protein HUA1 n=1 Tax=Prunus dulcis TaxID=3755 RepID=A0A4Y1RAZ9_PRUDU|nr:floral homeotic protein HUA1 [Prunus dulcis]
MSSHLYGYGAAQSAAAAAAATAGLSSVYTSRALTDPTLRYLSGSDPFASATDHHSRSSSMYLATSHLMSQSSWPATDVEPGVPGVKRPSEGSSLSALCHSTSAFCLVTGKIYGPQLFSHFNSNFCSDVIVCCLFDKKVRILNMIMIKVHCFNTDVYWKFLIAVS